MAWIRSSFTCNRPHAVLNREALFGVIRDLAQATPPDSELGLLIVRDRRFREYEALFGYAAGEVFAEAFGRRLSAALREQDRVVRIGECDFAAVLPALSGRAHAELAAAKVARAFGGPLEAGEHSVRVRALVGATSMAPSALTPETLCNGADRACAAAAAERERYALGDGAVGAAALNYDRLFASVNSNRLQLMLQPIFALRDGALKGFESLTRWPANELDPFPPSIFVPMSEQTGLIDELTRWNLNATLRLCSPVLAGNGQLTCSINLSPKTLVTPGFVDQVKAALRIWDVRPQNVVVEITETAFVDDLDAISHHLAELHEAGLGISIDDFGTGYSSLSYLKRFPVTELKIDGSFVRDLVSEPRSARLVASMIDMAHRLRATAVAEGIEDGQTLEMLRSMGCDHGQGYWLGAPQLAEAAFDAAGVGGA